MLTEAQMVRRVEDLVDVGVIEQLASWTPDDGPQHLNNRPAHYIMLVRLLPRAHQQCDLRISYSGCKGLCRSGVQPCTMRLGSLSKVQAKRASKHY